MNWNSLFGNWRTTLFGIITGLATYLLLAGVTWPTSKAEWGTFTLGLIQAIWGALQKDSTTGSQPS